MNFRFLLQRFYYIFDLFGEVCCTVCHDIVHKLVQVDDDGGILLIPLSDLLSSALHRRNKGTTTSTYRFFNLRLYLSWGAFGQKKV